MSNKPVVRYLNLIGWVDRGERGMQAELSGVLDHPSLGRQPTVLTSLVVRVDREPETNRIIGIETLNTIYKQVKE